MQNSIATVLRVTAMVGFIFEGPQVNAQPLELPTPSPIRDLLRKGDTFAAIRELRLAEAANPKNGETVLLLAYAYYLAGQEKLLSQKATAAAVLLPKKPEPRDALALIAKIHQRQDDCKQAIPALQRESLKQYEQLRAVYSSQ